jgi:hypothetical protein
MIRYTHRDRGVSIKLGDPVTENHGLNVIKKLHPRLLMLTNRMIWIVFDLDVAPGAQQ